MATFSAIRHPLGESADQDNCSFSSMSSSPDSCCSSFYSGGTDNWLIPQPGTLAGLVQALAAGSPHTKTAAARTLAGLCGDHINCWYVLKAGVVPHLTSLLASPDLLEETAFYACTVGSALARNCNGAELALWHLASALVMFLRHAMQQPAAGAAAASDDDDDDEGTTDEEEEDEPHAPLLSSRVALLLALALADLAFEQVGKRMIVKAGGIAPLLSMAGTAPSVDCRTAAMVALKRLAADEPCAKVMLKGGAKETVNNIMRTGVSPECKDCAMSLLSSLEKQSMLSTASN